MIGAMSTVTSGWIPADTFGTRLILARRHARMTVREAAARCGVHYATWSTWERGSTPGDQGEVVSRISKGLGVRRDWLMWGGPLGPSGGTPGAGRTVSSGCSQHETFAGYRPNPFALLSGGLRVAA
jgi:transcriptional regulator with XRE-family HTH domain